MSQRVHVEYSVPVSVVVDLSRGEIVDVQIQDYAATRTPSVLNENHDERIVGGPMYRAQRIADEERWPDWQFATMPGWYQDLKNNGPDR